MGETKILLAEDESIEARDIKRALESWGYDVPYVASSGEEVVEKALEIMPDLILIDIMLEGNIDGIEAAFKIKEINIPVIFFNDNSEDSVIEKTQLTESDVYITKSKDLTEIKYAIELAIYKNKTEKKLKQNEMKYKNIFENVQDIFFQTDNNGIITEISPSIERYSGYKPAELIGQHVEFAYYNLEDRNDLLKVIKEKGKVIDYELRLKTTNNKEIYVSSNTHILLDSENNLIGLEGTLRDITERIKARKALEESEQRLTDIIDFLPDATFAIDLEGKVIAWNRAIEEMTGTRKEDIIGKGDYAYSVPWYNKRRPVLIDLIGKDNSEYISEYEYVHKDGKTLYAEAFVSSVYDGRGAYLWVTASPLLDNKGQQYGAIESVRDISFRKNAEDALKKSESLYRTIFENTGAATLIYDKNGIISMVNSEMEHLSGFSRKEVEGRMNWMEFVHAEDLQMMINNHNQREKDPNSVPSQYETRFINRNGEIINAQITVDKIPGVEEYITSIVNITEQKKQHKNLEWELKINQALNKLYLPLVSKQTILEDISAIILSESLKLTDSTLGFVGEILPNTQDMILVSIIPPMTNNGLKLPLLKIMEDGFYEGLMGHSLNIKQGFFTNNAPSHHAYIDSHGLNVEKLLSVPVILKGELVGQIAIANSTRDYTEKDSEAILRLKHFYAMALQKVRDETGLKNSLAEKEVLLREIHHRVKNNMQIISSLLNLQIQYEDLDETVEVLKESQGRVKTMAIIHEKLYQSSSFTNINCKEYIEKLIYDIFSSYGIKDNSIESVLNIKDINLNIDTSIPLGLIINELVTNSVKYAFPKGKGKIFLEFTSNKDQMELIFADNGIGIPKELDIEKSKTLGLKLVSSLINQLDGKYELNSSSQGTKFKISFKELKYKERI